jgi:hypothetical protein
MGFSAALGFSWVMGYKILTMNRVYILKGDFK